MQQEKVLKHSHVVFNSLLTYTTPTGNIPELGTPHHRVKEKQKTAAMLVYEIGASVVIFANEGYTYNASNMC